MQAKIGVTPEMKALTQDLHQQVVSEGFKRVVELESLSQLPPLHQVF